MNTNFKDFRNFLYFVWKVLKLPEPTNVQYDIANTLQQNQKRLIIEGFRGIGKSWIAATFVCWKLLNKPWLNVLIVSATSKKAEEFSGFIRQLIFLSPLKPLKPLKNNRNQINSFDIGLASPSQAPSVKSIGITGQLTGSRAHLIIADDIETATNSMSVAMSEKITILTREFESILIPGGTITYLGTPHKENSIYNDLSNRGYNKLIWPALVWSKTDLIKYKNLLGEYIQKSLLSGVLKPNEATDPIRFTYDDLMKRQKAIGKTTFEKQFLLKTNANKLDNPLRLSDLIVTKVDAFKAPASIKWANNQENETLAKFSDYKKCFYNPLVKDAFNLPYDSSILAIDPSGRGNDESVAVVVKCLNGILYLCSILSFDGGYQEEVLSKIALLAGKYQVNHVLIESNFGDGMFAQLLKPFLNKNWPCDVLEIRQKSNKSRRIIQTLEPVFNQHRLVVDKELIFKDLKSAKAKQYSLCYQIKNLNLKSPLKFDDRIDALALAVDYFKPQLEIEAYKQAKTIQSQFIEEQMQNSLNNTGDNFNWID